MQVGPCSALSIEEKLNQEGSSVRSCSSVLLATLVLALSFQISSEKWPSPRVVFNSWHGYQLVRTNAN